MKKWPYVALLCIFFKKNWVKEPVLDNLSSKQIVSSLIFV